MAEGDAIHRNAARIWKALGGATLERADAPSPESPLRLQAARLTELAGRRLEAVRAHGKHLFCDFEDDLTLHCHQGMRGSWHLYPAGARWRRAPSSAWVVLGARGVDAVEFGGTRLALRTRAELRADPVLRSLGPDLLAAGFSPAEGARSLRARAEAGRALGEALLDQRAVGGIGNIYKSEGCFAAAIDPWRPLWELSDPELEDVLAATRELMVAGVERGRPPRRVYRRAGLPCPGCGGRVRARRQGDAARTTYWCSRCQA